MDDEFVTRQLDTHERRLNNHGDRIDKLEQYQSRSEVQINNLCEQIKSLVSTIKWSMGVLITTLVGFLIWYIQSL
jgi:aspartyl/asparaginyl beta-hydroxylase (cupin superfamily)